MSKKHPGSHFKNHENFLNIFAIYSNTKKFQKKNRQKSFRLIRFSFESFQNHPETISRFFHGFSVLSPIELAPIWRMVVLRCNSRFFHSITYMWLIHYPSETPSAPSQICKFKGENWLHTLIFDMPSVASLWQGDRRVNLKKIDKIIFERVTLVLPIWGSYVTHVWPNQSRIGKLKEKI